MPLIKNKVSQHDEREQIFNNTTQENCPERKGLTLPVEEEHRGQGNRAGRVNTEASPGIAVGLNLKVKNPLLWHLKV